MTTPDPAPRLINTYDQLCAAGGGIAIVPQWTQGREARVCGWAVYRQNAAGKQVVTDKDAPFYCYGKKVFYWHDRIGKAAALEEAKAWILDTYGERGPWKLNARRDYVPERIQKAFPIRREKKEPKP